MEPDERNTKDDLDLLKICVPEIPKDIIFPDELNRYLRDQIQHLLHENGMLRKNNAELESDLNEKQTEIKKLSNDLAQYKPCYSSNGQLISTNVNNIATGKIFELSRKLREKNAEVESAKTKCSKFQKRIHELETELENSKLQLVPEKEVPVNELEEKLKSVTEKLQITNAKLFDTKNSNVSLKTEIKLANKLLQQEIGDNFTTIQNLSQSTNWRGRAQQICSLQQKNSELLEKLRIYSRNSIAAAQPSTNNVRIEELSNEINSLKGTVQDLKTKLETNKSKRKILELEVSSHKTRIVNLNEQLGREQQIIDSLTKQLSTAQEMHQDATKQQNNIYKKIESENKNLKMEIQRLNVKAEELAKDLNESKTKSEFDSKVSIGGNQNNLIDVKEVRTLEVEKKRLLELTTMLEARIEEERNFHAETQHNYRAERQKAAKLEARIARLQLDSQFTDRSSSIYSRSHCKLPDEEPEYVLRNKLELAQEHLLALQTRLQFEQSERKRDVQEFVKIMQMRSNS